VEGKHHVRNGTIKQALDNLLVDKGNLKIEVFHGIRDQLLNPSSTNSSKKECKID